MSFVPHQRGGTHKPTSSRPPCDSLVGLTGGLRSVTTPLPAQPGLARSQWLGSGACLRARGSSRSAGSRSRRCGSGMRSARALEVGRLAERALEVLPQHDAWGTSSPQPANGNW